MTHQEDDDPVLAQLEAYYDGELTAEETTRLRERLATEPELAARVARWEAVHRHGLLAPPSAAEEQQKLRQKLGTFEAELQGGEAQVRSLPVRRWWLVAASILLLLLAGYWWLQRPTATEQLAEEYFEWLPRQEAMLGPAEDAAAGLLAYDRQQYEQAYPLLIQGVANGVLDSVNLLYAGVAALGAGEPEVAQSSLRELLDTGRYPLEEAESRYYLALATLRSGDRQAARNELTLIDTDTSTPDLADRVTSLLEKLNPER